MLVLSWHSEMEMFSLYESFESLNSRIRESAMHWINSYTNAFRSLWIRIFTLFAFVIQLQLSSDTKRRISLHFNEWYSMHALNGWMEVLAFINQPFVIYLYLLCHYNPRRVRSECKWNYIFNKFENITIHITIPKRFIIRNNINFRNTPERMFIHIWVGSCKGEAKRAEGRPDPSEKANQSWGKVIDLY